MIKHLGGRKLGRTGPHRRALMRNLTVSLILHERVQTTVAKAKELRPFAEKIISQAKRGEHHEVRRRLHNKVAYKKLFEVIARRYEGRSGGYTQILRLARRAGDNAPTGMVRLIP